MPSFPPDTAACPKIKLPSPTSHHDRSLKSPVSSLPRPASKFLLVFRPGSPLKRPGPPQRQGGRRGQLDQAFSVFSSDRPIHLGKWCRWKHLSALRTSRERFRLPYPSLTKTPHSPQTPDRLPLGIAGGQASAVPVSQMRLQTRD